MGNTSRQPSEYNTRAKAIENAMALLMSIQDLTEQISEHSLAISGMTMQGEQAIEHANLRLASVIFGDVHQASHRQREMLARMQVAAAQARSALAAARVGE